METFLARSVASDLLLLGALRTGIGVSRRRLDLATGGSASNDWRRDWRIVFQELTRLRLPAPDRYYQVERRSSFLWSSGRS